MAEPDADNSGRPPNPTRTWQRTVLLAVLVGVVVVTAVVARVWSVQRGRARQRANGAVGEGVVVTLITSHPVRGFGR